MEVKNYLKKICGSADFLSLIMLAGVFFLVSFLHFRSFGVYGDDWSAGTYLYHNSVSAALWEWWAQWGGEIANFRPLAAILPLIWFVVYQYLGLAGVFLVIYGLYVFAGWLLYKLLKKSLSPLVALTASMLFLVYPTNNFYLWQVTATYPLSLIFLFGAAHFFKSKRYLFVFCSLLASLLTNEGAFFLFFIAMLPTQKLANWKEFFAPLYGWLAVTLPAVLLYGIVRVILETKGLIAGGRAVGVLGHLNAISYLSQFVKSYLVVLVTSWGFAAWKILHFFRWPDLVIGLTAATVSTWVFWKISKLKSKEEAGSIPAWYIMAMGLVLIIAGRYYGFYYVPSINVLNLDSRYYFAASLGGALFFAGLLEYLIQRWRSKQGAIIILLALSLIFGFLAVFKSSVQRDYEASWVQAKAIMRSFLSAVPSLQPGQVVILNTPPVVLGELVGPMQVLNALHLLVPRIYNPAARGYISANISGLSFQEKQICITAIPDYFCVPKDKVLFFNISGTNVVPAKNYYFPPGVEQHAPPSLKAALEK